MEKRQQNPCDELSDKQLNQASGGANENEEEKKRFNMICQKCGNAFSTGDPDATLCPRCDSLKLKIL